MSSSKDDQNRRALADELTRQLTDQGKLIEAGYVLFRAYAIPLDAPQAQVDDMRIAFLAGAQHLWGSINSVMDADREPTDADMRRLSSINDELTKFARELALRVAQPRGKA